VPSKETSPYGLAQIVRPPDFDPAHRHPELQALLKTILAVVEAEIPSAS
jgi:hypothetical protein